MEGVSKIMGSKAVHISFPIYHGSVCVELSRQKHGEKIISYDNKHSIL
jgi:hypothetical protein